MVKELLRNRQKQILELKKSINDMENCWWEAEVYNKNNTKILKMKDSTCQNECILKIVVIDILRTNKPQCI